MDGLRKKLEDLKELRDLVRSLGRGGGWGPLRRAPVQKLDFSGRPGLLRTVLEAQETRGLTRSDDISRLLPAEAALLARGRSVRQVGTLSFMAAVLGCEHVECFAAAGRGGTADTQTVGAPAGCAGFCGSVLEARVTSTVLVLQTKGAMLLMGEHSVVLVAGNGALGKRHVT